MPRPANYKDRKTVNEQSRNRADAHQELWSADEIELLMAFFGDESDLREVAEILKRTVEACRQKAYEVKRGVVRDQAQKSVKRLGTWSGGFTSLDDMGY